MKLPFFTAKFVKSLRESAALNVAKYGDANDWLEEFAGRTTWYRESTIMVDPPPQLAIESGRIPEFDAENAQRIFTWLHELTPALAMEERLWACLSHHVFPEYMASRWPVKSQNDIHRRYLFEGRSFAALSRNGVARLWWAGYLTYDLSRSDPFELTRTLFMRQDIQVSLLERALGKSRPVRTAVLDYLRTDPDGFVDEQFGRRIQILLRELNLLGGVAVLDALPRESLDAHLTQLGRDVVANRAGLVAV